MTACVRRHRLAVRARTSAGTARAVGCQPPPQVCDDPSKPVATKLFAPELLFRGTTAPPDQANATMGGA